MLVNESLRAHVTRVDGPCKLWPGATNNKGYGQVRRGGRTQLVHRWAWEQVHGPIPPGVILMHRCDVPLCYEVSHLVPGSVGDNNRDMYAKGRGRGGADLAARSDCVNGHAFSGTNLFRRADGSRGCRECSRDKTRRYRQRKRARL